MFSKWQLFMFFLAAPVIGFFFAFYQENPILSAEWTQLQLPIEQASAQVQGINEGITVTKETLGRIHEAAKKEQKAAEEHHEKVNELLALSETQNAKSLSVLDEILSNLLGDPVGQTFGDNATVKVYSLEESGYRGYMAKVHLKNPKALKMVLTDDPYGETTSQAAKRKGAVLAVNAGGFGKDANGKLFPIGITVVDGKIKTFYTYQDLDFVGFNEQGRLVGGKVTSKAQLEKMGVLQGASFLPTLLKDGKKQPIPREWANAKHPRTLIGHFTNGDLLIIVIDGRRKGWSSGVTLEEAQDKLLEFHVKDAYNLDGGGSSAFYYNGQILNRPSDGRQRRVTTNLVVIP
ncbi:phosphodiester glycosidase family protein [Ammoniphilus resinae]|uniref:Exopolysaccharide biosynthesis protein n=1 Tax=Ammoniphilus resinae TaxID=861532 RepID=A0ABS4GV13_9BACL|nr:exopolysaccharide biosynthesis protein [Ammoniphilus resinae]